MNFITNILGGYTPHIYETVCPVTDAFIVETSVNFGYILDGGFVIFSAGCVLALLRMFVKGLFYDK
jgi:hypothetical protein